MLAVLRHELSMYFHSMTSYVFSAFLLIFTGIGAMLYNINSSVANFEYVLSFISIVFIIIVPILTMKIISDEKKQRTDQLLYSLPISTTDVVVGKFLALTVIFALPMAIICTYPLIFSRFGDVFLPTSYGSIFAFFLMGLALISIGEFISSLTESQGMAAGICVVALLLNYFCPVLANYVSGQAMGTLIILLVVSFLLGLLVKFMTKSDYAGYGIGAVLMLAAGIIYFTKSSLLEDMIPKLMTSLSLFDRFNVFVNGIFDLTGIVFYISVVVFFLFLTVQALEKRRYNG